jgi:hypothetical protein
MRYGSAKLLEFAADHLKVAVSAAAPSAGRNCLAMIAEAIKTGWGVPERSYRGAIFVSSPGKACPLIGPRQEGEGQHDGAHPREPFWVAARNDRKRTVASQKRSLGSVW